MNIWGMSRYAYVFPALFLVCIFVVYPMIYNTVLSFQDKNLLKPESGRYVGLDTFSDLFNDKITRVALRQTGFWVVGASSMGLLLALGIGIFLSLDFPVNKVLRGVIVLPWILPPLIVATGWRWMLQPEMGIINDFLRRLHLVTGYPAWLSSRETALITLMFIMAWRLCPFLSLMIMATLRGVPLQLYESASIDGAGGFQKFRFISLPFLRFPLIVGGLLTAIWTINEGFTIIYVTTRGGPGESTEIMSTVLYKLNFLYFQTSKAAAMSVLNLLILFGLSISYLVFFRKYWLRGVEG